MAASETYLKVRQVAEALGVSVSTIQRLTDDGSIRATRTMGRHRRVLLSSVMDYARREQVPVGPLLALEHSAPVEVVGEATVARLVELLGQGRGREASALIEAAHRSGGGAVTLADLLIRPAMERVGHCWMAGSWEVYQEHQATQVVIASLVGLIERATAAGPANGLPLALGASPDGDPYSLPVLLAELVLREVGWEVRSLGVSLPLRSLARAIRDHRPALVFLSASHLSDSVRFLQDYSYFYEAASSVGAAIILGGRALEPDLRARLAYASFGDRMAHLAEFARALMPAAAARRLAGTNQSGSIASRTEPQGELR